MYVEGIRKALKMPSYDGKPKPRISLYESEPLGLINPVKTIRNSGHIVVLGAGGTGSILIPALIRYLKSRPGFTIQSFTIIDGDVVETKNLERQNFVSRDLGENKAEVLARRYSALFGMSINSINEYLTHQNYANLLPKKDVYLFSTVDSMLARWLSFMLAMKHGVTWFDTGNSMYSGQSYAVFDLPWVSPFVSGKMRFSPYTIFHDDPNLFSKVIAERENSCAEHAVVEPQTLMANQMSAMTVLNLFTNFLDYMAGNIPTFVQRTYFDTRSNSMVSRPMHIKDSYEPGFLKAQQLIAAFNGISALQD